MVSIVFWGMKWGLTRGSGWNFVYWLGWWCGASGWGVGRWWTGEEGAVVGGEATVGVGHGVGGGLEGLDDWD